MKEDTVHAPPSIREPLQSASEQSLDDSLRGQLLGGARYHDGLDTGGTGHLLGPHHIACHVIALHAHGVGGQFARRVDHHPRRGAAGHPPHVETGIVRQHRSHADHDGVDMGSQRMQVIEGTVMVDPAAFARQGGNAAVQRLAELGHHERAVGRGVAQGSQHVVFRLRGGRQLGRRHGCAAFCSCGSAK
jgi:hypothetical protein